MPVSTKTPGFIAYRASGDTSQLRTDMFEGKDFLVVPVIALVQGVLQSMNSDSPELALAEEFGRIPAAWNGRPIVMNHPVVDGIPVSANSPKVLETVQFGWIFNAALDGEKLKVEAWLDVEKVKALGGEIATTVQRIQDGQIVEVSTGLFTGVEEIDGEYDGKEYEGIWRNIIPDHLAFLSEGLIGACSVDDGCGTPRTNSANTNTTAATPWTEYHLKEASMPTATPTTSPIPLPASTEVTPAAVPNTTGVVTTNSTPAADCGCTKIQVNSKVKVPIDAGQNAQTPFVMNVPMLMANQEMFKSNSYPGEMTDSDVRTILSAALEDALEDNGFGYWYIIAFTSDTVIYSAFDYGDYDYSTYQRTFTISADGAVTLGSEVTEVMILTNIVPVTTATIETPAAESTTLAVSQANTTGDTSMPENVNPTPAPAAATTTAAPAPAATTTAEVVTNAAPTPAPAPAPAPAVRMNAAEYVAAAPPELQEVLNAGLRLHASQKASAIKALKDSGRCKLTDNQLQEMNLEMLNNLVDLAQVPSYEGRQTEVVANEATREENRVPVPPKLMDLLRGGAGKQQANPNAAAA